MVGREVSIPNRVQNPLSLNPKTAGGGLSLLLSSLGGFFSTTVQITSDQRIVTGGPYRVIRHPAYSDSLFTLLGLGLSAKTWGGTLVIVVLFGLVYAYRISIEENLLKAEFGQEYVHYAKKTKRLIPFLL
jgi:protein-S-isoprenylcysteine O-methyltransferase Ste14